MPDRRTFSDFLILTRKKRDRIVPYARALEALNIPIEVSGAGAFGESAEVAALTMLLRALADPQDALALVAVLRGPLFGISDRELFAFKQAGGWFSIFHDDDRVCSAATGAGSRPRSGCAPRLAALQQYYRWTRVLPAAAALERILEDTGYLALAATTPGGVEAGDLLHAVDRVRQVVEEGGSLADAADALEADCEDTERSGVASARAGPHRRRAGDEPAQGQGARGRRRVPRRSVRRLRRRAWTSTSSARIRRRRAGSRSCRSPRASWGGKLLGEHATGRRTRRRSCRIWRPKRIACSMSPPRARASCSSSAGGRATRQQTAWGVLNDFLADAKELAVRAGGVAAAGRGRSTARPTRKVRGRPSTRSRHSDRVRAAVLVDHLRHGRSAPHRADDPHGRRRRPTTRRRWSAPTRPRIAPMPAWRGAR